MVKVNVKHKHCPWPACVEGYKASGGQKTDLIHNLHICMNHLPFMQCRPSHICMNHLQPLQGRPMRARCHGHECFMGSRKQSSSDPLEWEFMISGL